MNEEAYRRHCERSQKANTLYCVLKDLYGNELKNKTLFIRARLDKVITGEEKRLLIEYKNGFIRR